MWDSKAALSEIQVRSIASLSRKLMWGSKAAWSEIQVRSISSLSQELMWASKAALSEIQVRSIASLRPAPLPTQIFRQKPRRRMKKLDWHTSWASQKPWRGLLSCMDLLKTERMGGY
ncbi:uncharacterized protein LOC131298365 isoform X3 [Rhododendron vialii]|uniref:uncharacterized protein LOC131298365 isoform X3 n=1 Tax=Rhododendron vialii TaxID=182163 RepID=UPI0026603C02|nr:uncharacterized protein LOC131298365 isoform X3 [Rhododendron vialii]